MPNEPFPLSGMVLARGKKEPIRRRKRKVPEGGNVPIEVGIILCFRVKLISGYSLKQFTH
jgi:hypothetical protein